MASALAGSGEDPKTAWRYEQLGLLPAGSFGRTYWEHCTELHFAFPGEAGAFPFLIFGIVQFHLGVKITPIAEPEVGYRDVERVMVALSRGAACKVDLSDHWDHWPWMERPLDAVREELGIPPL
jgi:hypothetical protein